MGKPSVNRRIAEKKREKSPRKGKAPPSGLARDIGAVVLLVLAAASGLALGTWSALDSALLARGFTPSNLCGPVGNAVAGGLYAALGLAALVLPVGLGTAAWKMFRGVSPRITLIASVAYAVLTASTAALAQLLLAGRGWTSFAPGGRVGILLSAPSERLFSTWGSALLLAGTATVALMLAADVKVRDVADGVAALARATGRGLSLLGGFLSARLAAAIEEHRAAVAELREEEAERARSEAALADALADTAELEALGPADMDDARAVAGELAREEVRRSAFEDPAWAAVPAAEAEAPPAEPEEPGKKRRRARKPRDEQAAGDVDPVLEAQEAEL